MVETGDSTTTSAKRRQFLAYEFAPGSSFEGQLVGALERVESGGAMRILDALFVAREPESGELVAVSLSSDGSAGMVGRLLSFRLEADTRRRTTERVLDGPAGEAVKSVANTLEPGGAVAALLVEHAWAQALDEAIGRIGGSELLSEFVSSRDLGEGLARLVGANRNQSPGSA